MENSSAESEQDAAEDDNEEISTEKHSDYKPANLYAVSTASISSSKHSSGVLYPSIFLGRVLAQHSTLEMCSTG